MFQSVVAKALLGVGLLGAAGGTTALAAAPAINPGAGQSSTRPANAADVSRGVIVKVSDSSMTIEWRARDKNTGAVTSDDTTFVLNQKTRVYRAGDKSHRLGVDALKVGARVRVRFTDGSAGKVARRVVILPDLRAGKVIAIGDGYFLLRTAEHGDVKVVVTDKTRYRDGKAAGSFAGLKVGDRAVALGEEDSAHNFDAAAVRYHAPANSSPARH